MLALQAAAKVLIIANIKCEKLLDCEETFHFVTNSVNLLVLQ